MHLQELETITYAQQYTGMVSCTGLCAVYTYVETDPPIINITIAPIIPVQFYPAQYYVSYTPQGKNFLLFF